jgi:hypothetical protein
MTQEYLAELLNVMNNTEARKEMAIKLLKPHWIVGGYGFKKIRSVGSSGIQGSGSSGTSDIATVFGGFRCVAGQTGELQLNKCIYKDYRRIYVYEKNGIEVLGAKPNASGSTYSSKCRITVKELKEVCKTNGIKITGLDKKGLLRALMKI